VSSPFNPIPRSALATMLKVALRSNIDGLAIAQEVSRWHTTAAARVRAQVMSCGICGGQWHWGRFSPNTSVSPHSTSGADTIGQLVADIPNGLTLTPPQETKQKLPKNVRYENTGISEVIEGYLIL
jgi:hypothetical protein